MMDLRLYAKSFPEEVHRHGTSTGAGQIQVTSQLRALLVELESEFRRLRESSTDCKTDGERIVDIKAQKD